MLQPKRTKFRKYQKRIPVGVVSNSTQLQFGQYGIKSLNSGRLSARTIEAVRRSITRKLKRTGQVWIRIFPDIPVTEKPAEVRMGKGKGSPAYWICRIKAGQILFEIDGVSLQEAHQASCLASQKLPFQTKFIHREK